MHLMIRAVTLFSLCISGLAFHFKNSNPIDREVQLESPQPNCGPSLSCSRSEVCGFDGMEYYCSPVWQTGTEGPSCPAGYLGSCDSGLGGSGCVMEGSTCCGFMGPDGVFDVFVSCPPSLYCTNMPSNIVPGVFYDALCVPPNSRKLVKKTHEGTKQISFHKNVTKDFTCNA